MPPTIRPTPSTTPYAAHQAQLEQEVAAQRQAKADAMEQAAAERRAKEDLGARLQVGGGGEGEG